MNGIWIRSQDKSTLIYAEHFYAQSLKPFGIVTDKTDDISYCLGVYPTRERALEILVDIQNQIIKICNDNFEGFLTCPIFEMPAG